MNKEMWKLFKLKLLSGLMTNDFMYEECRMQLEDELKKKLNKLL